MEHPPAAVLALAANYQCGHCNSEPAQLTRDAADIWHLNIRHDDGCPVLVGALSALPDTFRALKETS